MNRTFGLSAAETAPDHREHEAGDEGEVLHGRVLRVIMRSVL